MPGNLVSLNITQTFGIQVTDIIKQLNLIFLIFLINFGVRDLFKNDRGGRGSVLTKYEAVASHMDPFRGRNCEM